MIGRRTKINWKQWAVTVLIVILSAETGLLIKENRELKAFIKGISDPIEPLKPGDNIEPVTVQRLDGTSTELLYTNPNQRYLIFVFSTDCPHCDKTLPVWDLLTEWTEGNSKLAVIGISSEPIDTLKSFVALKQPDFPVLCAIGDASFIRKYGVGGYPATILLNGNGIVLKTWLGELGAEQIDEIQALSLGE